jgi:teichuronic acid biosynthesis glycosyltransferase TuaC
MDGAASTRELRVLVVTNLLPTPDAPGVGVFVRDEVESLRALGVHIEVMHLDRRAQGRGVYARLAGRLRQQVSTFAPDLIHVMYGGVMADIVTRRIGSRPVVVSFCGTDLLAGSEGPLRQRLSRRYNVIASHRAARRAAGIIVKSRNLRDALHEDIDPARVWIVPDGVDFERFVPGDRQAARSRLGWTPGVAHVVFPAAETRPEKNFPLAHAAVDRLRELGTRVELHALTGLTHDEVPTWLNAADAVLLTSTHEGSPNAVKEAMACDVPVVAVDVGDVRERIGDVDGCYVGAATPDDLAAKLSLVLARAERPALRSRVEDVSLHVLAERLLGIYRDVNPGLDCSTSGS